MFKKQLYVKKCKVMCRAVGYIDSYNGEKMKYNPGRVFEFEHSSKTFLIL